MSFLSLIWANLMRKKIRTFFTAIAIFVAFMLFGGLMAFKAAFGVGIELAGIDRLILIHKTAIIQPLPLAYLQRIQSQEGVEDVTHANWFGGVYQDARNFFPKIAVDAESYLRLYPEIKMQEGEREAWMRNRTGAIVGKVTADRFGWKVGDRIPVQGDIYRTQDGSPWEFTIESIYTSDDPSFDTSNLFFHYKYLEEASGSDGQVGWYILRVADPQQSAEIAKGLDQRFANSPAETKTTTEKAFIQSFANQTGNIAAITTNVVIVVFFTLLLVAGNTMAQSVRERINELAVLKTLGFSDGKVMGMVLGESLLLTLVSGALGLTAIVVLTNTLSLGGSFLPTFHVPTNALLPGLLLMLFMGLLAGLIPSFQALRLSIVDALSRRT